MIEIVLKGAGGFGCILWDTMPNELEVACVDEPLELKPLRTVREIRLRWFELALVLLICVGDALYSSVRVLNGGANPFPLADQWRWAYGACRELICLFLLGYVLSRRKIGFKDLGLRWSLRDVGIGLILAVVAYLVYWVGSIPVYLIHHAIFPAAAKVLSPSSIFGHPSFLAIPYFLLSPFFEEMIVRAYLMTEVGELTGSWVLAAAASVLVQFSYHLYYGWVGAICVSFQFLVFAIYYARRRKTTPIVVAHGVFDIIGLIRML
jgi:uncharacterized protein